MERNVVETIMGAVVLLVAAVFVVIAYQSGNVSTAKNGYNVTASFKQLGAINIGNDVRISGIKVGSVINQRLDPKTYLAVVTMNINGDIKLPTDSSAAIVSDGLLGGKYIELEPGADETYLKDGGVIHYTQDAVNFEQLIGKFAFGSVSGSGAKPADKPAEPQTEEKKNSAVPSLGL